MASLAKIIASLGLKLLSETVVSRVACYTLMELAKSTENKLDDKIVDTVCAALGVPKA